MSVTHNTKSNTADWAALSVGRADVYAWFSRVLATELNAIDVRAYCQGDAAALLRVLAAIGLAVPVQRLEHALQGLQSLAYAQIELAADFARLFLLDAHTAAIPYASAYVEESGQLYGDPHKTMQTFLHNQQLQLEANFREPADHISVFLAFFEDLLRKQAQVDEALLLDAARSQRAFLQGRILTWLPQFETRCQNLAPHTVSDFYPAITTLLLAFIRADVQHLESLLGERV